jgi:hypothetical protein
MAIEQSFSVAPPNEADKETLNDYSEIIQRNFESLFGLAHSHGVRTSVPSTQEGEMNDIITVNLEGTYYLYVKVSKTQWARTAALTLV